MGGTSLHGQLPGVLGEAGGADGVLPPAGGVDAPVKEGGEVDVGGEIPPLLAPCRQSPNKDLLHLEWAYEENQQRDEEQSSFVDDNSTVCRLLLLRLELYTHKQMKSECKAGQQQAPVKSAHPVVADRTSARASRQGELHSRRYASYLPVGLH